MSPVVLLVTKALIAPVLLAVCTYVAHRWGAAIGGWLLGLPIVTGPVSYFLLLEHGPRFAENAAIGTLLGFVGTAVFCAGYALTAKGKRPWQSLAVALTATVLATVVVSRIHPTLGVAMLLVCSVLFALAMALRAPQRPRAGAAPRKRDLALRMAIASAVVIGVTLASTALGSQFSGMLAAVPIISAIMAVSAHRSAGSDSARGFLHGTIVGLWGAVAFFVVVCLLVTVAAPGLTYLAATVVAGAVAMLVGRLAGSVRLSRPTGTAARA